MKPLKQLGSNNKKLRMDPKGEIEFLCVGCKNRTRISRVHNNLCFRELPNGSYLLTSKNNCSHCKDDVKKVYKIISKKEMEKLNKNGVIKCHKNE